MTPEERFQKIEETLQATAESMRTSDRQWKERIAKFDESVLVTAEMQRTSDRRWERRLAEHDARLARVEQVVKSLAAAEKKLFRALDILHDEQGVTRSMLDELIKNIDRFVRGHGGDGRGGQAGRRKG